MCSVDIWGKERHKMEQVVVVWGKEDVDLVAADACILRYAGRQGTAEWLLVGGEAFY